MGWSRKVYSPVQLESCMPIKCSSVDLPAPEGPMMETNSPSLISALMRRSTNVLVGPCSKYFSTFRSVRIGELIVYVSIVTHWEGQGKPRHRLPYGRGSVTVAVR